MAHKSPSKSPSKAFKRYTATYYTSGDIEWCKKPLAENNALAKNNFDRIKKLRLEFCHPLMVKKRGKLNKNYFSGAQSIKDFGQPWNDIENMLLIKGIIKYGVSSIDSWIKIQKEFLPKSDFMAIRFKISQFLGIQNLSKYKAEKEEKMFKTEQDVFDEFKKNKEIGLKNNTWDPECQMIVDNKETKDQKLERFKEEFEHWKKYEYDSSLYLYRLASIVDENGNEENVENVVENKEKPKDNSNQKNGNKNIKQMFDKQKNQQNNAEQGIENRNNDSKNNVKQKLDTEQKEESDNDQEMTMID